MADYPAGSARVFAWRKVLARASVIIRSNRTSIAIIVVTFGALPVIAWQLATTWLLQTDFDMNYAVVERVSLAGTPLVKLVAFSLVQRALICSAAGGAISEVPSLDSAARAPLSAVPLMGLTIVSGTAIMAGLVAAFVPGAAMGGMWIVAAPVLVLERRGIFAAMNRSAALTRGIRWRLLAPAAVAILVQLLVLAIAGWAEQALDESDTPFGPFTVGVLSVAELSIILSASFLVIVQASLYPELRDWTDHRAYRQLTDIFA